MRIMRGPPDARVLRDLFLAGSRGVPTALSFSCLSIFFFFSAPPTSRYLRLYLFRKFPLFGRQFPTPAVTHTPNTSPPPGTQDQDVTGGRDGSRSHHEHKAGRAQGERATATTEAHGHRLEVG